VTRFVAPVWSSGPNGDGLTKALQSAAAAGGVGASNDKAAIPTNAANQAILMVSPPILVLRLAGGGKLAARMAY